MRDRRPLALLVASTPVVVRVVAQLRPTAPARRGDRRCHLGRSARPCGREHVGRRGTSHADTWRSGLIHGPRAPFTVPYDGEARAAEVREERADMEVDAVPDPQRDMVIALAAARQELLDERLSM